jgi:hypothetical protein
VFPVRFELVILSQILHSRRSENFKPYILDFRLHVLSLSLARSCHIYLPEGLASTACELYPNLLFCLTMFMQVIVLPFTLMSPKWSFNFTGCSV